MDIVDDNFGDESLFADAFSLFESSQPEDVEDTIPFTYLSQPNKPKVVRIKV